MKYKVNICRSELEHLIDEWIFSERDREVMKLRLLNQYTYEDIGERTGLSDRHVPRIINKNIQILLEHNPNIISKV